VDCAEQVNSLSSDFGWGVSRSSGLDGHRLAPTQLRAGEDPTPRALVKRSRLVGEQLILILDLRQRPGRFIGRRRRGNLDLLTRDFWHRLRTPIRSDRPKLHRAWRPNPWRGQCGPDWHRMKIGMVISRGRTPRRTTTCAAHRVHDAVRRAVRTAAGHDHTGQAGSRHGGHAQHHLPAIHPPLLRGRNRSA